MNDLNPSKNGNAGGNGKGKGSRIMRLLHLRAPEPASERPAAVAPEPPEEDLDEKVDRQIGELQRADQQRHNELLGAVKLTQKKVRCAQLRMKRLNGGLTQDEEAELAQEC